MWSGVVLLEDSVVILHNWKNMWLQNVVTIMLSRQITIGVYQLGPSSMWYGCVYHYAFAIEFVDCLPWYSKQQNLDIVFSKLLLLIYLHVVTGTWIRRWTRLFSSAVVAILDASEPIGIYSDDNIGSNWQQNRASSSYLSFSWLKYCRYSVKHYTINQSIN